MYSHHEMTESNSFLVEVIFVMMFFYFYFTLKPIDYIYIPICVYRLYIYVYVCIYYIYFCVSVCVCVHTVGR